MNEPRSVGLIGPMAASRRPAAHRIAYGFLIGLVTLDQVLFACLALRALWDVLNGLHGQAAMWVLVWGTVLTVLHERARRMLIEGGS
jgi:hypothetical protein